MKDAIKHQDIEKRFKEVFSRLHSLIDDDPRSAIEAAHKLAADDILNRDNIDMLASVTLVDAGFSIRDSSAVNEGVQILERLATKLPEKGDVWYCLGTGLSAQAELDPTLHPSWYLTTIDIRRRARQLYYSAGDGESTPSDIKARSYTNLANSLLCAHRLVEAYDYYSRALEYDATNGVALTGAARILLRLARAGIGDSQVLLTVAGRHLKKAKENPERIRAVAGERAYIELSKLLASDIPDAELPDFTTATEYQRFVARHRLALSPTIEGLDLNLSRWDSLGMHSISEAIDAGSGIPPLLGMFNVLKSEYLTARYLTYLALNSPIPESGKYSDTLDYAIYGTKSSMFTLAQRACLDVLDKVAVAASEYLGLPGSPSSISFSKRWFNSPKKTEPLAWQPEILDKISLGNTALIAICEVAADIESGGFLHLKRSMRHSSTHRFTILHDIGEAASRESRYIEHYSLHRFIEQLLETLQLTRAVLFYFVEMIALNEQISHDKGTFKARMDVPDHDWIRGKNNKK